MCRTSTGATRYGGECGLDEAVNFDIDRRRLEWQCEVVLQIIKHTHTSFPHTQTLLSGAARRRIRCRRVLFKGNMQENFNN